MRDDDGGPRFIKGSQFAKVAGALCLLALGGYIGLGGCQAGEGEATQVLRAQGFTKIELGGRSWLTCASGEASRAFAASNSNGVRVEGAVCCGIIAKGCTVRW